MSAMEQVREKGRRWVISTREEMRQAVIEVSREAKRKVSIFTHDLEPGIYDDPEFLEIIKRLILSQTYCRIRVLIADPTRAVKTGNNFVHLGRRLNTYIEFRHVREDLRTHAESFCIADETALVYRLQANRWEGIADTYEPAVAKLYGKGLDAILKKIGEEATETVMAAKDADRDKVIYETADLWFHSMILLAHQGLHPDDVLAELDRRFGLSGLEEKARRGE